MNKIFIYQIYYNEDTRSKIEPGILAIDNTDSDYPDLYEFWVILKYLRENDLKYDEWYGFLSPKFAQKTGICYSLLLEYMRSRSADHDVCLFSPSWDQIAFYLNPWEQGEAWHPGLMKASQEFIEKYNIGIRLEHLISDSRTAVFSNFVIARRPYWDAWKIVAEKFFEYCVNDAEGNDSTFHGSKFRMYPMKAFIQERLAALVLLSNDFNVQTPVQCKRSPIQHNIFPEGESDRDALSACDFMKGMFRHTADAEYLHMYYKVRQTIRYIPPSF